MTAFNTTVQLVMADGLDFVTKDDENFHVRASEYGESDYFQDTSNPQQNLNTIEFNGYSFGGNRIKKLKVHFESGLLTDKLALDTMSAEIESGTRPELSRYTPITVYRDGDIKGVFFNGKIEEIGSNLYSIYGESYLALLDYDNHPGGIYRGETAGDVIASIMGDVAYTIHPDVAALKLFGYLPYTSKRENLQQVLLATGAALKKNPDGTANFTVLTSAVTGTFGDGQVFIDGSLKEDTEVTAVQVTEHAYVAIEDEITLFTEAFTDVKTSVFPEPAHDLVCTNGAILESGANYAVIQGNGNVILTGKKYQHTTKVVTRGTVLGTPDDKILSVSNGTLITLINSSSVAQRLYKYASCKRSINQNVLPASEHTGEMVQVVHPYKSNMLSAAVQSLDLNFSNTMRAAAEFLLDYEPQGISEGYKNRVLISSNDSFTVPAGVTEIRAVLIGGGKGGAAGQKGENGSGGSNSSGLSRGSAGKGGKSGEAGTGGKVFDTTITVTPGQVIPAAIGTGGIGGAANGEEGAEGTATTFGDTSSSLGSIGEYVDAMTAERFAITGTTGVAGADGQGPGGVRGGDVQEAGSIINVGGLPGQLVTMKISSNNTIAGQGGGGGGAAYGNNGSPGSDGHVSPNAGEGFADGGDGGRGADAIARTAATIPGSGGDSGHGGGGGGGGGDCYNRNSSNTWPGAGAPGGLGGPGGKGADGCIIIYY